MLKASVPSKRPRATKGSFSKWTATAANSGLLLMFALRMSALESETDLSGSTLDLSHGRRSLGAGADGCAGVSALQLQGVETATPQLASLINVPLADRNRSPLWKATKTFLSNRR